MSELSEKINEILEREFPNWGDEDAEKWTSGSDRYGEFDQVYVADRPFCGVQDVETILVENGIDVLDFVLRSERFDRIRIKVYKS